MVDKANKKEDEIIVFGNRSGMGLLMVVWRSDIRQTISPPPSSVPPAVARERPETANRDQNPVEPSVVVRSSQVCPLNTRECRTKTN